MDNLQELAKEEKDIKDWIELGNDINMGLDLKNIRDTIPMYHYNQYGYLQINNQFIQNENDIVQYINNINQKYITYINLINIVHPNIQWNVLENCIELLQKILISKILGKAIEEIFRGKEK